MDCPLREDRHGTSILRWEGGRKTAKDELCHRAYPFCAKGFCIRGEWNSRLILHKSSKLTI